MQDLLILAEQLKEALSTTRARRCTIRFGGEFTNVELTRAKAEELTAHLVERTIEVTERTVATARANGTGQIDTVLLSGGMTRMPVIPRLLQERLGIDTCQHEPDLAVAKGAAIFALMRIARSDNGLDGPAVEEVAAKVGLTVADLEKAAAKRVSTVVPRAGNQGVRIAESER